MARSASFGDFCFVHAADLHLDTPFHGVTQAAPAVGAALREASLEAFDRLVELCLERQAAFLLIAGDVYDGPDRGLRAQFRLKDGLERLADAGISSLVVHGNHDPVVDGWGAVGALPEPVHVFGAGAVGSIAVERAGTILAIVHGISYGSREVTENLALRFSRSPEPVLQIGLLHCNVAGAPDGHAPYSPCTLTDLRRVGLDYWALGHVHTRTVMSGEPFGNEPWVVYPGNLQARSPKQSERGAKGATVVEVRAGRVASVEAVACDVVRFSDVTVDIADCVSMAALREHLASAAARELAGSDDRSLVLRARLVGRGPLHAELTRDGIRPALLEQLREDCGASTPFVWWGDLVDDSRSLLDRSSLRGGGDFLADLLDTATALGGAPEPTLPVAAGSVLGDTTLEELLGKMPVELRSRALALLGSDITLDDLLATSTSTALDLLEAES